MSADVEEWFQVSAFEKQICRDDWQNLESRVHANTCRILELFAMHQVKATFFCFGWIAKRHRDLLQKIVAEGHELASHGYSHVHATEQSPVEFAQDVSRTKAMLEDISGTAVRGDRAASFSIGRDNLWALDCLQ
jgi:polysaccharide deacetylase family protein (PEP-CTERM system associated)